MPEENRNFRSHVAQKKKTKKFIKKCTLATKEKHELSYGKNLILFFENQIKEKIFSSKI
jgi:hypothetical protein